MNGTERLGNFVRNRRAELGIGTAKRLAETMNVTPRLINDIENGRRDSYSANTLALLDRTLSWQPGTSWRILNEELSEPIAEVPLMNLEVCDLTTGIGETEKAHENYIQYISKGFQPASHIEKQLSFADRLILVTELLGIEINELELLSEQDALELLRLLSSTHSAAIHDRQITKFKYWTDPLPSGLTRAQHQAVNAGVDIDTIALSQREEDVNFAEHEARSFPVSHLPIPPQQPSREELEALLAEADTAAAARDLPKGFEHVVDDDTRQDLDWPE